MECTRSGGGGGGEASKKNFKSLVVLFLEVSFECSFEGMGRLNVTDVRREQIPLLWSINKRWKTYNLCMYAASHIVKCKRWKTWNLCSSLSK